MNKCCYIYSVLGKQIPFARCPREAIWQIISESSNDPYDYTESCDKHVGQLLDDSPIHHVYRLYK